MLELTIYAKKDSDADLILQIEMKQMMLISLLAYTKTRHPHFIALLPTNVSAIESFIW